MTLKSCTKSNVLLYLGQDRVVSCVTMYYYYMIFIIIIYYYVCYVCFVIIIGGMFTANTMSSAVEALGMAPPGQFFNCVMERLIDYLLDY